MVRDRFRKKQLCQRQTSTTCLTQSDCYPSRLVNIKPNVVNPCFSRITLHNIEIQGIQEQIILRQVSYGDSYRSDNIPNTVASLEFGHLVTQLKVLNGGRMSKY